LQRESAAAVINERLLQERATRNRELAALYEVASSATQSLELKPVLDGVVKKISDIFNFDATGIYLLDSYNENLSLMASSGSGEIGLGGLRVYRPGQGIIGRVAATGQPMVFDNIEFDPRYQELSYSKGTKDAGFSFFAIFPVTTKLRFVGTILLLGKKPRKLSHEEIRLISSMSEQIGIAVENMRLFEEVRNKTTELERSNNELREALAQQTATSEILRVIASSPTDLQPMLDAIAESAARLCEANDAVIRRLDGNVIRLVAHYGRIPPGGMEDPNVSQSDVVGRAIIERRAIHVPDLAAAEAVIEFPNSKFHRERSEPRSYRGVGTADCHE
jgi:GAF domain-containing protein